MTSFERQIIRAAALLLALGGGALAQERGALDSGAARAAERSRRPQAAGEGGLRPGAVAGRSAGAVDRLLCARMSRRGEGAAGRWRNLAGHAAFPQPQLGPSGDDRLPRALLAQGGAEGGLARHSRRRHLAATRRPDAVGARLASGRARRRHLADADARPQPDTDRARGDVGGRHGRRGRPRRRSRALDAAPGGGHPGGGGRTGGRTHLRQCRDQEETLRDRARRSLDDQGARLLGAQLPFPCPHRLSRRRLRAASRRSRSRRATAATSPSPGGSPTKRCIPVSIPTPSRSRR